MKTAASADAHHRQRAMLFTFGTGAIVNVGQRVEFVGNDIDIVASDAVRLAGNAFAFVGTSDGMEFTT